MIRLLVTPGQSIHIKDLIRGDVVFQSSELDDKVLLKADGMPTYHLANIIDDHLMRITEAIDSGRDLLGNCVDAYLSAVGQRTNEIMKQLTILSAIMLPLTFISGFFGMNFEMLPFKSPWVLGVALALMFLVIPVGMLVWFLRKRWL